VAAQSAAIAGIARDRKIKTLPLIDADDTDPEIMVEGLRNFGVRVEHAFALGGPDAQRVFVEQLFVGFKKIHEQAGSQQFKGADQVSFIVVAISAALERLRASEMPKLSLDLRLFQVLPDKALHLMHQGDPDSFIQFCGHENS
jgi:hypothetical protein